MHYVPVLESDGDGLPLDRRRLLVADVVDDVVDLVGEAGLAPVAEGLRDAAPLD